MLKTLKMALDCCPVGFSEEIIAVCELKNLKLTSKMTKIPKFSNFQRFYAFISKFSTDFVDLNIEKGQQGTKCSPAGFSEEFIVVFLVAMSQI